MEIKSTGVLGNIGTPIDISCLTEFGDKYRIHSHLGCLKIVDNITACIYKTGKVQIYGIKNIDEINKIWGMLLTKLKPYIDVSNADKKPILKFIVASEKLSHAVNLKEIQSRLTDENIEYEPEQFPALFWKMDCGTCLLFSSGSMIISGCSNTNDIQTIIRYIKQKIDNANLRYQSDHS